MKGDYVMPEDSKTERALEIAIQALEMQQNYGTDETDRRNAKSALHAINVVLQEE